jgi:hypothetical protein
MWNVPANFVRTSATWRIAAKFVPRLLSSDQKECCFAVCTELKEQAKNYPNFIFSIIAGDKF